MAHSHTAHESCTCRSPVEPGSQLEYQSIQLSRALGGRRVEQGAARALVKFCQGNSCSQSSGIRFALAKLAKESDPSAKLDVIYEVLDLKDDASASDVHDAIDALLAELAGPGPASPDPMADTPGAPPATAALRRQIAGLVSQTAQAAALRLEIAALKKANTTAEVASLSKEVLAAVKAEGWTPEQFLEARSQATRRAGDEPRGAVPPAVVALSKSEIDRQVAALSPDVKRAALARGLSPEDFVQRRNAAVRRA